MEFTFMGRQHVFPPEQFAIVSDKKNPAKPKADTIHDLVCLAFKCGRIRINTIMIVNFFCRVIALNSEWRYDYGNQLIADITVSRRDLPYFKYDECHYYVLRNRFNLTWDRRLDVAAVDNFLREFDANCLPYTIHDNDFQPETVERMTVDEKLIKYGFMITCDSARATKEEVLESILQNSQFARDIKYHDYGNFIFVCLEPETAIGIARRKVGCLLGWRRPDLANTDPLPILFNYFYKNSGETKLH